MAWSLWQFSFSFCGLSFFLFCTLEINVWQKQCVELLHGKLDSATSTCIQNAGEQLFLSRVHNSLSPPVHFLCLLYLAPRSCESVCSLVWYCSHIPGKAASCRETASSGAHLQLLECRRRGLHRSAWSYFFFSTPSFVCFQKASLTCLVSVTVKGPLTGNFLCLPPFSYRQCNDDREWWTSENCGVLCTPQLFWIYMRNFRIQGHIAK